MALFLSLLPVYLFGNLHCFGMCGPLAFLLGRNRFRVFYLAGRIISFTLTGALAGSVGAVSQAFLHSTRLSGVLSLSFGLFLAGFGLLQLAGQTVSFGPMLAPLFQRAGASMSLLLLKDQPLPVFLFGFCTVFLPCGQTLLVFSACALEGGVFAGTFNGFVFALFTTPALFLAMNGHPLLTRLKKHYAAIFSLSLILVGMVSFFRGLADMEYIPHFVLGPAGGGSYHIVLF